MKRKNNYLNRSEKLHCMAEKYLYQASKIARTRWIRSKNLQRKRIVREGENTVQVYKSDSLKI